MKLANFCLRKAVPLLFLGIAAMNLRGAVITDGFIRIAGLLPTGTFNFSRAGFTVNGPFTLGAWGPAMCFPCSPGSLLSVNGVESGNDFGNGSAVISGTPFNVSWGSLNAAGNSNFLITGAPIILNHGPGIYTGAFNFSGELCGTSGGGIPQPCVVNLPALTGSGVVTVNLIGITNNTILQYTDATYVFSNVPEPSTLGLTVPAGLLLYFGTRKRRRSSGFH